MKTLRDQKRERILYAARHPGEMRFYARQMWRGLFRAGAQDAMESDPEGRALFPPRIFFVINSGCNLKCRMCDVGNAEPEGVFYRNTTRKRTDYLTLEEIDAFAASVAPHLPEIVINGTEPTIHPRLGEVVGAFTSRSMRCEIITNGIELKKHASALLEARLSQIVVSLDGPDAQTHDAIRAVPRAFERSLEGMHALMDERDRRGRMLPLVVVTCVIQPGNHDKLVRMAEWASASRIDALTFAHVMFTTPDMAARHNAAFPQYPTATFGVGDMDPTKVDSDLVYEQLQEISRRFGRHPIYVRPELKDREAMRAYYQDHRKHYSDLGYTRCPPLWHSPQVYPNGDVNVTNACFAPMFGNIRNEALEAIWNGEAYRTFRKTIRKAGGLMPGCARCSFVSCTTAIEKREFLSTRRELAP